MGGCDSTDSEYYQSLLWLFKVDRLLGSRGRHRKEDFSQNSILVVQLRNCHVDKHCVKDRKRWTDLGDVFEIDW